MEIIMYHYVRNIRNSRYPRIKGLELEYFKQQIQFLKANGFEFVTLKDILQKGDLKQKSVLLTFDDGYLDHYLNVFPILRENEISGVFSIPGAIIRERRVLDVNKIHFILASANTQKIKMKLFGFLDYYRGGEFSYESNEILYEKWAQSGRFDDCDTVFIKSILQRGLPKQLRKIIIDNLFCEFVTDREEIFANELYMNIEQVKLMKKCGMEFALHGYEHDWLDRMTDDEVKMDTSRALEVFDGVIDTSKWTFVYPYGSYSDKVISISKLMGANAGIGTDVAIYNPKEDDIFKIPRLDTNDFPPKSDNYQKFLKIYAMEV